MNSSGWMYLGIFLLVISIRCVVSENIKVVAMYGKNTAKDDLYKQINIDASTYVNDGNLLASGDQINVIHLNLLEEANFEEQSFFQSLFQICSDLRNTGAAALILPNDFCPDDCDGIGAVVGDAYSPVLAIDQADGSGAFKMAPPLDDIEEMITDVIAHFKWDSFIFLQEGGNGFDMMQRMSAKGMEYGWSVTPIELDVENFYQQSKELRKQVVKNILVYVNNEDVLDTVIQTAFEAQLLSNGWHWIIGNLNPPISQQFLDQKYRHSMAFLTRFKVESNDLQYYTSIQEPVKNWTFRPRAAYDALVAVAMALKLYKDEHGRLPDPIETCNLETKSALEPYLKRISFRGASGDVSFNEDGDRVNYTVIMYSGKDQHAVNEAGIFTQDVKSWERAHGKEWPGKRGKRMYIRPFRQSNAAYIKVIMVTEPPFFMDSGEEARRYEDIPANTFEAETNFHGISWDLLQEVKKVLEEDMEIPFTYRIFTMNRGQYGSLDLSTGEWDGAMKEIIDGDADVVMGSMVINAAREKDVDFTTPWYVSYCKLLIIHPTFTFEYPFALIYPFDNLGWAAIIIMFSAISILTFLFGRFNPYEWRGRSRRNQATAEEGQLFTFTEAMAFVLSTGFWQGFTKGPRSWALRTLAVFWFWTAISLSFIYVKSANEIFRFSKTAIEIEDQTDLLDQDQIEFGVVRHDPAYDLYRYGNKMDREIFDRILNSELDLIENRIEDAVLRMRRQWDGRYTILGEEKILEYAAHRRPCQLYISGSNLGNITFGFVTASGSPLRDQLTYAINILRNRGVIDEIVGRKYSENLACRPTNAFKEAARDSYTAHDLQGMYYLLAIGMTASLIVFIMELLYYMIYGEGRSTRGGKPYGAVTTDDPGEMGEVYGKGSAITPGDTTGGVTGGDWL